MKKEILVEGMSCMHCVKSVTEALEEIGGENVDIDLDSKKVLVDIDKEDEQITEAIEDIGFDVASIK